MKSVQNIIFDLGGVILNIDYFQTENAFKKLGIINFAELYTFNHASRLFEDYETGKLSSEEFVAALKKQAPCPLQDRPIIEAWNKMLLDFPLERLQLLQQLRGQYEIYLLSNTNALHLEAFNKILMESRGIPSLGTLFEKTYYSHLVGLRKPGKEIYELVLQENGLDPAKTLFIDDNRENIEGAKETGLKTIWLQPPQTILDIFRRVEQ